MCDVRAMIHDGFFAHIQLSKALKKMLDSQNNDDLPTRDYVERFN
jgi:hypothetical protein